MIPVAPADEPATFDSAVRQPGLRAIAEMIGEAPTRRSGRRHRKVAASRDEIPPDAFPPYWRKALDDLLSGYRRICAYLCLYIPRGVGAPSVDHMLAKSRRWDQVYEWSNYRLACSLMNSRKATVSDVLDPFEIEDGWFALELVEFQVVPGDRLPPTRHEAAETTIRRLGLCDGECCGARAEYAEAYWDGHISLDYLTRRAPFVAHELRRQNRLTPADG